MPWFDLAEGSATCPGPMGPVVNAEVLARLLHENTIEPEKSRFPRRELFAFGIEAPSDACAVKDGASVDRCDSLSQDEVDSRSAVQAARKPGRQPRSAHYAVAGSVRKLRLPTDDERQIFKIYDDARLAADQYGDVNAEHAVIRGDHTLTRPQQNVAIDLIIRVFSENRPAGQTASPSASVVEIELDASTQNSQ